MFSLRKVKVLYVIAILICIALIYWFVVWMSSPEYKFKNYIAHVDVEKLRPADGSVRDFYMYLRVKEAQMRTLGKDVTLGKLAEDNQELIETKFKTTCKIDEKFDCPVEDVLLWYAIGLSRIFGPEVANEKLLRNETFKKALSLWGKHFKKGIKEDELREFMFFIVLLNNLEPETLEKDKELYVKLVTDTKITSKDASKRVYAIRAKLASVGLLFDITEEDKIGELEYVKEHKLLEETCPLLPSVEEIKASNDPCAAHNYLKAVSICEKTPFIDVFMKYEELRSFFLQKEYNDAEKISCQLLLTSERFKQ